MISATLANTRPGYVVEGFDTLPASHPQHPSRKAGALLKMHKIPGKTGTVKRSAKPKVKKRSMHGGTIVINQTIVTRPGGGPT